MKNHRAWLAAILAAGGLTLSACATEDYVDSQDAATNARVDAVNSDAQAALARADAAHRLAKGNFRHSVLFTDDSVKFDTNSSHLSADAQASLAAFADRIRSDDRNVYIEIQGHADDRGSEVRNHRLGHARAAAVMDFLNSRGIPLYHMSATSYGDTRPTGHGHAEDRRVVLVVMN
jgi:peptidoglycan-associated lipoprotein